MRFIPYGRQSIDGDDIRSVLEVLRSDWITQGPKIKEFESALCRYTGAKYAVAVSSGTAALHIACLAGGIGEGDEVITSPITFAASANCILYSRGKPVFADILEDTINIDPEEIRKNISPRTRAVIPVHFAGDPCDLKKIKDIARKHKLLVIEDAAHALGAKYQGSRIGSCRYSDMTIFSFHPVKSITTGEGGAVLTNNKGLYHKLLKFRNHGITKERRFINKKNFAGEWFYEMQELGFNYRLTDIQAALGLSQLKKIDFFISRRRSIARSYDRAFKDNTYFDLPVRKDGASSSCHLYPIMLKDRLAAKRRQVFSALRKEGLGVQVHYIPVYFHPYYRKLKIAGTCLKAEDFYRREISLPIYPDLSLKQIAFVVKTVLRVLREADHGK